MDITTTIYLVDTFLFGFLTLFIIFFKDNIKEIYSHNIEEFLAPLSFKFNHFIQF